MLPIKPPVNVSEDHYLLEFSCENRSVQPGQFVNVKIGLGNDPLLRRPFSIYDKENNRIKIIFKVIGKGTSMLKTMLLDGVESSEPLGNGFTVEKGKKCLLIGGGVGNAPLYFLAKSLRENSNNITFIYGARSEKFIYMKDEFKKCADRFIIATDDGTYGVKGNASDAVLSLGNQPFDRVYICGPSIMMKSCFNKLENSTAKIEISVENYFGCGIGICSGCTIRTSSGQKRACKDGPVFDARTIDWSSILHQQ